MNIRHYIQQIEQQQKEQDAIYHSVAVKYGLSDTALWVLYVVSETAEALTQQDLRRQCFFAKQTINSVIASLMKANLVMLKAIPGTRNQKSIHLTEAGQALAASTTQRLMEAENRAYARLTEQELAAYLDMTARLTAALREETTRL